MILARVAANTADFAAFVDQHEQRRKPFHCNEAQIRRQWIIDIYAPQWRALAFRSFCVNRRNFSVKCLAPGTAGLLKHYKFRGKCGCCAESGDGRTQNDAARKKFQNSRRANQLYSLVRTNDETNRDRRRPSISRRGWRAVSRSGNRANCRMNAARSEHGGGDRRRGY